jgi:hypothetical protein
VKRQSMRLCSSCRGLNRSCRHIPR